MPTKPSVPPGSASIKTEAFFWVTRTFVGAEAKTTAESSTNVKSARAVPDTMPDIDIARSSIVFRPASKTSPSGSYAVFGTVNVPSSHEDNAGSEENPDPLMDTWKSTVSSGKVPRRI
jgi:hypothetical protein